MLTTAEAETAIHNNIPPSLVTTRPLRELFGCVLAESIAMERDQPPFDRVTMDGIAINSSAQIARWRIAATQAAGAAPMTLAHTDDCIEVMTGAQLPHGCDCVIPVERLSITDGIAMFDRSFTPTAGLNIQRRGVEARAGITVLEAGTPLTATEIAIIASAGYASVRVRTPPRIALISTGNELIEPGQPISDWQVRRSNTYALYAALQQHGLTQLCDAHLPDDLALLREQLALLLNDNDVLVLSGGVSMGKFDFVPQALSDLGVQCMFHKIAQKPGKPLWFGVRADGKAVYALPGNPVSTLICLHRYVLPGLYRAMGAVTYPTQLIALSQEAKASTDLSVFLPIALKTDAHGITRAEPRPTRGSGDFISLFGSDGFVELPPCATGRFPAGTAVPLYRW